MMISGKTGAQAAKPDNDSERAVAAVMNLLSDAPTMDALTDLCVEAWKARACGIELTAEAPIVKAIMESGHPKANFIAANIRPTVGGRLASYRSITESVPLTAMLPVVGRKTLPQQLMGIFAPNISHAAACVMMTGAVQCLIAGLIWSAEALYNLAFFDSAVPTTLLATGGVIVAGICLMETAAA